MGLAEVNMPQGKLATARAGGETPLGQLAMSKLVETRRMIEQGQKYGSITQGTRPMTLSEELLHGAKEMIGLNAIRRGMDTAKQFKGKHGIMNPATVGDYALANVNMVGNALEATLAGMDVAAVAGPTGRLAASTVEKAIVANPGLFPDTQAGMIAGPTAKGWGKAENKFSAVWDKKARFEISDKGMGVTDKLKWLQDGENIKLGDAITHPTLFKNYPDLKEVVITAADMQGASYGKLPFGREGIEQIKIGNDILAKGSKKTILHEIQHAIQQREGFARGGSPESSSMARMAHRSRELDHLAGANREFDKTLGEIGPHYRVEMVEKFNKVMSNPNPKPSSLLNMSLWYEVADTVRNTLGAMPKRKSPERTRWIQGAAQMMRRHYIDSIPPEKAHAFGVLYEKFQDSGFDIKPIKNAISRGERKLTKLRPEAREFIAKRDQMEEQFSSMSDMEAYRHLSGEVEARDVASRSKLSKKQRAETPMYSSEDIPADKLITWFR